MSGVELDSALVYLEDTFVYRRSVTKHLIHVRTVLALLQNAGRDTELLKVRFL